MEQMLGAGFVFTRVPVIHFGVGKLAVLPKLVGRYGDSVLLVTGSASFARSVHCSSLMRGLADAGIRLAVEAVRGEPSPPFVDDVVARHRAKLPACVIAIGGGSAIDAGKAISAMLTQEGAVRDFLEGMETRTHDGRKVPFIAVPTSSGTGAEATKNAVLSEVGLRGFKRSLRHDNFVPDIALVDPVLTLSCPAPVTAACGLDALTQLLEAYVSTQATPMTDALALSGLQAVASGFVRAVEHGASNLEARSQMAYAALLSGIVLAQAGLGLVHGFAGPIGGRCAMPHGEVCGTLLGEATRHTLEALRCDAKRQAVALEKYGRAGAVLSGGGSMGVEEDCDQLMIVLDAWIERMRMPRLSQYGVTAEDLPWILDRSNGKNSPVVLARAQMEAVLLARL